MGFKPIFEEERQFFKKHTGIYLPTDCWRNGKKIYLDFTQNKPVVTFDVKDNKIVIKTNVILESHQKQKKIDELISIYKNEISDLYERSVKSTMDFINNNLDKFYIIGTSGGKDSDLVYEVWKESLSRLKSVYNEFCEPEWVLNFAFTTNDTGDTIKKIKSLPQDKVRMLIPDKSWRRWIKEDKNYLIPTVLRRNCCQKYKEGQTYKEYDTNRPTVQVLGVRRFESTKRSKYTFNMTPEFYTNILGKNSMPSAWQVVAPIVDWKDEFVWLYIISHEIKFNQQYKYGFNRCGCLICPYQSDYIDLIIQDRYPNAWEWWVNVLKENYSRWMVKEIFKWSFEEFKNGMWKTGKGKVQILIEKNPTKDRVEQVSKIMGIAPEMAIKYFNRHCECGKKLNPTESAMNFKWFGRYQDIHETDNTRKLLCKKCFCKEIGMTSKQYSDYSVKFRQNGCALF